MAPTPYPLPESARQSAVLLGDGSTTYGPFGDGWGIFDSDDVLVETRAVATTVFAEAAVTIAKVNPAAAYDFFTVTFAAPLTSAFEFRVTGKRLQERELAVTRGGAIDGVALEKELSKVSVVLQEQRRDIDNTAVMVAGDAASSALADRLLAQAAAASAAASAAILAGALAILVGNAGGTASAPTLSHASFAGLVAYPNDMLVVFRITAPNPGAMTLAALPLAAKPFVDRVGDAFVGGEWDIGDIAIALYNVTNNQFRALDRMVDVVSGNKANIFSQPQTFLQPLILPGPLLAPGGRLTLDISNPVMKADFTAITTISYVPYLHDVTMLYDGSNWVTRQFTAQSQTLADASKSPAAAAPNSVYDIFQWDDAGTVIISRGPAWSSASARGAGAGTTELEQLNGRLVNKFSIVNGPLARRGVYLGTISTNGTGVNGQLNFMMAPAAAAGGSNNRLDVWNYYNRVKVAAMCRESTDTWVYTVAAWRAANNSNGNRISFIVGVVEDAIDATLVAHSIFNTTANSRVGVGLNSLTAISGFVLLGMAASTNGKTGVAGFFKGQPALGFNFVQWLEYGAGSYFGDDGTPLLNQSGINLGVEM